MGKHFAWKIEAGTKVKLKATMRKYKDEWKADLQERGRQELEKLKKMNILIENAGQSASTSTENPSV